MDSRILPETPAAKLRMEPKPKNKRKRHFIDAKLTKLVMDGLEDARWRILFALLRYQGMRRCEIAVLEWSHIDWVANRLQIHSPKTGYRESPIFPETLPYLLKAAEERGESAFVIAWQGPRRLSPLSCGSELSGSSRKYYGLRRA